jgi:phosphoesterase RecJ-like protein
MSEHTLNDVLREIARHRRFIVTAHEKPDGDALGAVLGLVRILRARGCDAVAGGLAPVPRRYLPFIHAGETITAEAAGASLSAYDAVLALDAGTDERCPPFVIQARGRLPVVNIDHHGSNTRFGDINWVDPAASSVGEMVFRMAEAAGWEVARDAAEALWIAVVTDTGRFAYENTTPEALRIGAELVARGVATAEVDRQVYQSFTVRELALQARAIQGLELHEGGRVAVVGLSREDFASAGSGAEDAEDVANIPRSVGGVKVGAFLYEIEKPLASGKPSVVQTKISLRCTEPYDGAAFCRQFGGGGHARAAGCTLPLRLAEARAKFLEAVHRTWFECGGA